jgi:hypothetical protein
MDKAALLARVVDQVRHLKRRASEAAQQTPAVPPETDEVSVEFCCTRDTDDDNSRLYQICADPAGLSGVTSARTDAAGFG